MVEKAYQPIYRKPPHEHVYMENADVSGIPLNVIESSGIYLCRDEDNPDRMAVALPHSCGEWVLTEGTAPEVMESLERFKEDIEAMQEVAGWVYRNPQNSLNRQANDQEIAKHLNRLGHDEFGQESPWYHDREDVDDE